MRSARQTETDYGGTDESVYFVVVVYCIY